MAKIKIGSNVGCDFGKGTVIAITKQWIIIKREDNDEICLYIPDGGFYLVDTGIEEGLSDEAKKEIEI